MLLNFPLGNTEKGICQCWSQGRLWAKNVRDKHFGLYSTRGATILPLDLLLDSLAYSLSCFRAMPWFIWADDRGRFMIIFPEHLVQKKHWQQNGGVKLCIPAAFTQSLLKLKSGAENGCTLLPLNSLQDGGSAVGVGWAVQPGFREYWLSNFDSVLHTGQWALRGSAWEVSSSWDQSGMIRIMIWLSRDNASNAL